jgi:hypothetical protein
VQTPTLTEVGIRVGSKRVEASQRRETREPWFVPAAAPAHDARGGRAPRDLARALLRPRLVVAVTQLSHELVLDHGGGCGVRGLRVERHRRVRKLVRVRLCLTIDVDDLGEPGTGRDIFAMTTGAGFSRSGVLTGGNVQVRSP